MLRRTEAARSPAVTVQGPCTDTRPGKYKTQQKSPRHGFCEETIPPFPPPPIFLLFFHFFKH